MLTATDTLPSFAINSVSDETLVTMAQSGDEVAAEILFKRLESTKVYFSRRFFLPLSGVEDMFSICHIAISEAIRDYRQDRDVRFKTFAGWCIKKKLITALRRAQTEKRTLEDGMTLVSFDDLAEETYASGEAVDTFGDLRTAGFLDLLLHGKVKDFEAVGLSKLEARVIFLWRRDISQMESAEILNVDFKSIDNAFQKGIKKLRRIARSYGLRTIERMHQKSFDGAIVWINPSEDEISHAKLAGRELCVARMKVEGISVGEMAERMGCSIDAVKAAYLRAHKKLARLR